jgi:hypothetical protein
MQTNQKLPEHTDFLINKSDFSQRTFRHTDETESLADGQVRLAVDKFALTANNITYAVVGDQMQYWNFFPSNEDGFGRVPVWGFADITESRCDGLDMGERVYGFLPISTDFIATPVSISSGGFLDGADHRQQLHPVYNQYTRVSGDPAYVPSYEAQQMILRPLFVTSFLIDVFLRDNNYFGADRVILSSASSKTAIGTAYQLAHEEKRPRELVGLTSEANQEFVAGLGLYDTVIAYDAIESLDRAVSSVLVDMAGNDDVLQKLHAHLADNLKYSCRVGKSHWDAKNETAELAGPKPEWFFAPAQFKKRAGEVGIAQFMQEFSAAALGFVASTNKWMEIVERQGEEAIQQTFDELLQGRVPPSRAFILSL